MTVREFSRADGTTEVAAPPPLESYPLVLCKLVAAGAALVTLGALYVLVPPLFRRIQRKMGCEPWPEISEKLARRHGSMPEML